MHSRPFRQILLAVYNLIYNNLHCKESEIKRDNYILYGFLKKKNVRFDY